MKRSFLILIALTLFVWIVFVFPPFLFPHNGSIVIPVSFLAAFFAGVFAILSPCSAALLPAFFAYSFQQKKKLMEATGIFFLGLATIFVPLGFSASLISKFFITQQRLLFTLAGIVFLFWGVWALVKQEGGSSNIKSVPGRSFLSVYVMGVFFAFTTGTCAAPVIGAIFTLASTFANSLQAILLLLTFALGLTLPLFFLSFFFERLKFAEWKLVRGRLWEYTVFGKRRYLHSNNLILSSIFIGLGFLFFFSRGTNAFLAFFDKQGFVDIYYRANSFLLGLNTQVANLLFVILLVLVVLYILKQRKKPV